MGGARKGEKVYFAGRIAMIFRNKATISAQRTGKTHVADLPRPGVSCVKTIRIEAKTQFDHSE
jgi:hypothetical protein